MRLLNRGDDPVLHLELACIEGCGGEDGEPVCGADNQVQPLMRSNSVNSPASP